MFKLQMPEDEAKEQREKRNRNERRYAEEQLPDTENSNSFQSPFLLSSREEQDLTLSIKGSVESGVRAGATDIGGDSCWRLSLVSQQPSRVGIGYTQMWYESVLHDIDLHPSARLRDDGAGGIEFNMNATSPDDRIFDPGPVRSFRWWDGRSKQQDDTTRSSTG
ncbi:hypothetical protein BDBG_04260 [Blastomyces gilchristii SLH14081]|uniref:Uncharacterized protein n=1 Tax=Blastomyces gilchristii (strain SLH14081) TaxID=559298 RepID=A0A179UM48_BLAGS|nr:uncharacterized protein BDBG_04260 [Blastomyces gilchristii SLH14081]OAT08299.1 hypothetical protein BDBG_04260 [Blastomyces gilchristii SLH14081]